MQHPNNPSRSGHQPPRYTSPLLTELHTAQPATRRPSLVRRTLREGASLTMIVLVLYLLTNLLIPRFMVEGDSMEPTFHNSERVVVSRLDYVLATPARGDVVVFEYGPQTYLIKRIVGLPGEEIQLQDGAVFVNGQALDERYITSPCHDVHCQHQHWALDKDEYFVLGDNRPASLDSHHFGPIKADQIVGRVRMRYWPFSQFDIIDRQAY